MYGTGTKAKQILATDYMFIRAAFILATWLGDFTLVYTTCVVQNLYKEKKNDSAKWEKKVLRNYII